MRDWIGMARRGLRKPPRVIVKRIVSELRAEIERLRAPRLRRLDFQKVLVEVGAVDLDSLWRELAARPYPAMTSQVDAGTYDACCPGDAARVIARADDALAHRVDMLGSGPVTLGKDIDWQTDFRSGIAWPEAYFSDIDFSNPNDAGDVKVPWELSRLQWLIPLGQAYLLTSRSLYAEEARAVLEQWIERNPYAGTVNWSSTMEVALRILSMTWLFHVFHATDAWADTGFRQRFLTCLYLHADFVDRQVVSSEVNAGVYTISAAGLVFGGLFFGSGRKPAHWLARGWSMCTGEIGRQIHSDGTEFEGAISYHRLAMEFFLLPALYRMRRGFTLEAHYRERLLAMARYAAVYSKPNGLAPLLGDDGGTRALPFDSKDINDHRFMVGLVGAGLGDAAVSAMFSGPRAEVFWLLGDKATRSLPEVQNLPSSQAFPEGGYFVMRSPAEHVFIDCAPVGLAGRGGHGHNDCLSFEAVLDGVPLVTDRGTLTYTASFTDRNTFRATASHNTPQVDGEEVNRFTDPNWLWSLKYDAVPELVRWQADADHALFVGRHAGYLRLASPVLPERIVLAEFATHALYLADTFTGEGRHRIVERLQLAPGVEATEAGDGVIELHAGGKLFLLRWKADAGCRLRIEAGTVSPAYGVTVAATRLTWTREGDLPASFAFLLAPTDTVADAEPAVRRKLATAGLGWGL